MNQSEAITLLREALHIAVIQNSLDMLMTGDELRVCGKALTATEHIAEPVAAIQPAGDYPYTVLFQAIGDSLDSTVKIAGASFSISVKAFVESIRAKGFDIVAATAPAQPEANGEAHQHRYINYPDGSSGCEFCSAAPVPAAPADKGELPFKEDDDDPAEIAYWNFDARRKGYSQWKECPQTERDAFKAEYRNALADRARQAAAIAEPVNVKPWEERIDWESPCHPLVHSMLVMKAKDAEIADYRALYGKGK